MINKKVLTPFWYYSFVQVQTSPVSTFHLSSRSLPAQIVHSHASMMPADCWWDVTVTFSRQLPCASADRLVDGRCWSGTCENPRVDPEKNARSPDHHLNQESTRMSHYRPCCKSLLNSLCCSTLTRSSRLLSSKCFINTSSPVTSSPSASDVRLHRCALFLSTGPCQQQQMSCEGGTGRWAVRWPLQHIYYC